MKERESGLGGKHRGVGGFSQEMIERLLQRGIEESIKRKRPAGGVLGQKPIISPPFQTLLQNRPLSVGGQVVPHTKTGEPWVDRHPRLPKIINNLPPNLIGYFSRVVPKEEEWYSPTFPRAGYALRGRGRGGGGGWVGWVGWAGWVEWVG